MKKLFLMQETISMQNQEKRRGDREKKGERRDMIG
jgi:hypothetical protein